MKRLIRMLGLGLMAVMLTVGAAVADEYLGSYVARISNADHYNSAGVYLDSAAQMVRQDRANYHKFGIRDGADDSDPWFRTNAQRARLQSMLERAGAMSSGVRSAIRNGTPLIEVEVWSKHVRVNLM